jgi:2-succinyl-5-enolpyruvyl-6-hydroxy-3-cyclohexene-1-carboxylate synthase
VLSNRGANGIDGTVSTALGVAAVSEGPTVLLTGDLAFLHDLGGMLAGPTLGIPLTIVLVDNDGGGIFSFLAVASQRDAFEGYVATPHGPDLAHAAALFGCAYERVAAPAPFRAALERGLAAPGVTILHVRTDRDENVAVHRRVWEAVRASR